MPLILTLGELAKHIGAELFGEADCPIRGVATLAKARTDEISFLAQRRYRKYLATTRAAAVILAHEDRATCPVSVLVMNNPALGYARAAALLNPGARTEGGIHASACVSAHSRVHDSAWIGPLCVIEASVVIAERVIIGPGCVVAEGSSIGAGSRLMANVTLCGNTSIGQRVLIHPGAVIGSDGFGLANDQGVWVKIPQLGRVVIGNDVEIGANSTIDRGALDDTIIEEGVKMDNQIQIGHNVYIGAHTAIAGCVGIAGSVKIGKRCMIGGGVGIAGHLEIADDVHITGMSLVTQSVTRAGIYSSGIPAESNAQWNRTVARLRQLEEIVSRLRRIEKIIGGEKL